MLAPNPPVRPLVLFVLAVASLSAARLAHAESAEVEKLIRQAVELRKQKRDADAFPLLQKAHSIGRTARTAAQLGLVEYNLGYWLDSEEHLSACLAARLDPWVHQNRAVLEQTLAKARAAIGEIVVTGSPNGAEVTVNGKRAGVLPLGTPVRVGYGPAEVEVRAEKYRSERRSVVVAGRQRHEISIELQPETVEPPPVAGSTIDPRADPPVPQTASAANPAPITLGVEAPATPTWLRTAAWASAAGAAVGLGVGIWGTTRWHSKADEFDAHKSPMTGVRDCGVDDPRRGGEGCAGIYSQMQTSRSLAIVGYVAGGLLAASSATMFVLTSRDPNGLAATCTPGIALAGGVCRLAF